MSPRPGPRKPTLSIRISDWALAQLDAMARGAGIYRPDGEPNRSETVERLIDATWNKQAITDEMAQQAAQRRGDEQATP